VRIEKLTVTQLIRQSQSYFTNNGRSVSQSVSQSVLALSPSGTHDHILIVVKTVAGLFVMGHPVERTSLSCDRSQSLSVSSDIYSDVYICTF